MSRCTTVATFLAGALLLGVAPGMPDAGRPAHADEPSHDLLLDRTTVKFLLPAEGAKSPSASVQVRARYDALAGPSYFQLDGDAISVSIAGTTYRVVTGEGGAQLRYKSTRLRYSRPRAAARVGLRSLSIDVVKGTVRARIDVADAGAIASTGAWDVPVSVAFGEETFGRSVDMRTMRQRHRTTWRYRVKDASSHPIRYFGRTGFDTPLTEPRNVMVRDALAWMALWTENGGEPQDLPDVDFATEAVIGVFLGDRTGFSVSIDRARRFADRLEIVFTEHGPGRTCYVAQVVTQPYALAKIPATDAPVEFRSRVRRDACKR